MRSWPLYLRAGTDEEEFPEKNDPGKTIPGKVPKKGDPGSFWEDRRDSPHCGIDLYAPENTGVVSIDYGLVTEIGLMTSPELLPYWNPTYYVIIKSSSGLFCNKERKWERAGKQILKNKEMLTDFLILQLLQEKNPGFSLTNSKYIYNLFKI